MTNKWLEPKIKPSLKFILFKSLIEAPVINFNAVLKSNWDKFINEDKMETSLLCKYKYCLQFYSARCLIGSQIVESAAYCNQKLQAHLCLLYC